MSIFALEHPKRCWGRRRSDRICRYLLFFLVLAVMTLTLTLSLPPLLTNGTMPTQITEHGLIELPFNHLPTP